MARAQMSVDFAGVFDLEKQLRELGDEVLKTAVVNALGASKDYVNSEIKKAINASSYNFNGQGYSQLKTKDSLTEIEKKDVEIRGMQAIAYAGVSFYDAPELWFIANGAPNTPKDNKIYNAVRVKGDIKKEVEKIQKEEFTKAIKEALNK